MNIKRREFIKGSFWTGAAALSGCRTGTRVGRQYPGWREGELDIHFIHTGVGEQTFFIFPDGTNMLLDCGHVERRPEYAKVVPPLPSGKLRGGEWVSRYLGRVVDRREIDYLLVSHWHDDHVMGIPDVAREFLVRNWCDHQFPNRRPTCPDADSGTLRFADEFLAGASARGMKALPFEVGACNQFALLNDARSRRYGNFAIRNISANGVLWDGRDGKTDYAAAHLKSAKRISENPLSAALLIRYGAFSYYTGGDTAGMLNGEDGNPFDWEAKVGAASGPVDVCKTNHHAFWDAMQSGFVREIRARVYLSSVWSPSQVTARNLPFIASRELYPDARTIRHGFMPIGRREEFAGEAFASIISPQQGHSVVKVAPGGDTYRVFTLSAADESMTVLACADFCSRGTDGRAS